MALDALKPERRTRPSSGTCSVSPVPSVSRPVRPGPIVYITLFRFWWSSHRVVNEAIHSFTGHSCLLERLEAHALSRPLDLHSAIMAPQPLSGLALGLARHQAVYAMHGTSRSTRRVCHTWYLCATPGAVDGCQRSLRLTPPPLRLTPPPHVSCQRLTPTSHANVSRQSLTPTGSKPAHANV